MDKVWMYNDRSNSRRRALRLVSELIDNEQHREGEVEDNLVMEISDEESDHQNIELDVEDKEVHEETAASVEDHSDLGEPYNLWISTTGPLHCRISSIQASMVSDRLIALRNYIPCEFARRPRALADRFVKLNERDSCVKIDNQLVLVQNIVEDEGGVYLVGNEYKQVENFFKYPIDSKELGIYVVSNLSTNVRCFMTGKELQKCFTLLSWTNEVEVVPSVWIKNGECMCPPNKSDITKAVKSQESPGDDWKPHKAIIIFTSFGYKEGRRKLPLAVDHTDIDQTDGGNSPITFQRKRKPKNIIFPGEDDYSEMEGHQKEPKSKKGRYSILDAPKIARQHKLDPGKPSCPKLCHSTPDLPNDEMKRIKGTKSRKRRHALPNDPVITREQISPVVDNLHLSGQSSPDLHSHGQSSPDLHSHGQSSPDISPHGQSSPDVNPHGQSSPHLRPHSQMSHNLRPSCYYSPDLYADGHSTPEIHLSPQTSTTMLSSGWHVRSESCTSGKSSTETLSRHAKVEVNTLALKGGTDVQECVWRIMYGLFTNSLARKVNMRGVNGKTGFLRLQIRDVVIAAVRRNHLTSEATEKEIDSTVKRWLYLAPDRDGGRKERMKNKVSEESTTG
ncbi:uncharacterized protein LOC113085053 isoform X1 [Tachysurus ichikawai]